jgi:hypothetical protein
MSCIVYIPEHLVLFWSLSVKKMLPSAHGRLADWATGDETLDEFVAAGGKKASSPLLLLSQGHSEDE